MNVELTVEDGIATILLNRPHALNSISEELAEELFHVLKRVDEDNSIFVAIMTGVGEKAFCTGSDLKRTPPPDMKQAVSKFGDYLGGTFDHLHARQWHDLPAQFMKLDKPLIAAVNGYALGGGTEYALLCDIRLASENAKFGLPEVKIGSMPGFGGTQRLPRSISASDAMLMLLTGDTIDAQEALRIGLVSKVVPFPQLMDEAKAIARRIMANGPMSVRAVKRAHKVGIELSLEAGLEYEFVLWGMLRGTEDYKEGRKAFAEKRPPVFKSL